MGLNDDQWFWRRNGYLVKNNFIPHELIDAYCKRWLSDNDITTGRGYQTPIPYMWVPEIRDLCLYKPLMQTLSNLIGYQMGLHLNLTDWISTERNWHQDDYLNPDFINGHYVAVWFALDDISENAGPFEFIPSSHKWPTIRGSKVVDYLREQNVAITDHWPKSSERVLNDLFEQQIREKGISSKKFLPKKGDVLIWHAWLTHRGSEPKNRDLRRKAIISHYSSVRHRTDMLNRKFHENREIYFSL